MSIKEWGKRAVLGVGLLIGAQSSAHAAPATEKPSISFKTPEKAVTLNPDELAVIERLSKLVSPDPEKQKWAQGKMAEKLKAILSNQAIKTAAQRQEAVRIYEEAGQRKLAGTWEQTDLKHMQRRYDDGVDLDLQYRISTDGDQLRIETRGPVRGFSAISYLKDQTWASAPTPKGQDPSMWRHMIENDLRNLYLDTRILEDLGSNFKSHKQLAERVSSERRAFEQRYGSILDDSFPGK